MPRKKEFTPPRKKKFPNNFRCDSFDLSDFYIRPTKPNDLNCISQWWWLIQGRQMIGGNKMENKTDDTSFYFWIQLVERFKKKADVWNVSPPLRFLFFKIRR